MKNNEFKIFAEQVVEWYRIHQRSLTFRQTYDPYSVWLSEIIFQQTRLNQGMNYYNRFLDTFPDIYSLANASENSVMKMWEGLGYYSRAVNLHKTSKIVVEKYQGQFPEEYEELLKLPGIGRYTAAAIASRCFGKAVPALDGNVNRVMARSFLIHFPLHSPEFFKTAFAFASELIQHVDPELFNQAMIDLGATICLAKNPQCQACPIAEFCKASKNNLIKELPIKNAKTHLKERQFLYAVPIFVNHCSTWLLKRTENDIWKNLYQFPFIELSYPLINDKDIIKKALKLLPSISKHQIHHIHLSDSYIHLLTHQKLTIRFVTFYITGQIPVNNLYTCAFKHQLNNFALPKPLARLIDDLKWDINIKSNDYT